MRFTQNTNIKLLLQVDQRDISCLKNASVYLMEDERALMFNAAFEKRLEELRMQSEKAEFAKGSLIPRRRTYGKPRKTVYYWGNN